MTYVVMWGLARHKTYISYDRRIQYSARQVLAIILSSPRQLPRTSYHEWISLSMIVRRSTGSYHSSYLDHLNLELMVRRIIL